MASNTIAIGMTRLRTISAARNYFQPARCARDLSEETDKARAPPRQFNSIA
jgi:hypothetical protein